MLIDEVNFMISNTPNDAERVVQMQDLKEVNKELNEAVQNLIAAGGKIVKGNMLVACKGKADNAFLGLTIDRVLGVDIDVGATNYDAPLSSKENKRFKTATHHMPPHVQHLHLLLSKASAAKIPIWPNTDNMLLILRWH